MADHHYGKNGCLAAGWLFALKQASLIKISYMLGSKAIFFSGSSIVGPLLGSCTNMWLCSIAFAVRFGIHGWLGGAVTGALCALHIPGWLAAFSWTRPCLATKVLVPLACMVLFIAHPIGGQVWFYTLYWLIPVALYFSNGTSIFAYSLSATFIAHAAGSVIRLYTVPMSAGNWALLMPIVPVERLLFASAMTVLYYSVAWGYKTLFAREVSTASGDVLSHNNA